MAAQTAADACLKLADSRSAGLQQRIEELTRQIEQDPNGRKKENTRRKLRCVCWPWQRLQVMSASSRAKTWYFERNCSSRQPKNMCILLCFYTLDSHSPEVIIDILNMKMQHMNKFSG
jgi:hypothetical protein